MKKFLKWTGLAALVLLLLTVAAAWAAQRWIGTENFRQRAEREAGTALGAAVKLERIDIELWPLPALALTGMQIHTQPALTLERLEVRPAWRGLMQGRLELATVLVRGAMLPQAGMDALLVAIQKKKLPNAGGRPPDSEKTDGLDDYIPRRTVLDQVTWIGAQGSSVTLDVDVRLSEQGLPQDVTIKVQKGQLQGAQARLQRPDKDWVLAMEVGGGTVKGSFQLEPATRPGGVFFLKGQLQTRAVEVAALSSAARPVLSGRLDADSTLSVRAASLGAMLDALQTQSRFTVRNAVVHGIDLAQAVKTVGLNRGGETRLDTLAGQLTSHGRAFQLTNLAASSGVLSASGNVAVASNRALNGRVSVDLAASALGSAVSVPLLVGGTLNAPEVTLTRSALIGAAIGTAMLPGVGTGAGASMGDKVGSGLKKLFGQ